MEKYEFISNTIGLSIWISHHLSNKNILGDVAIFEGRIERAQQDEMKISRRYTYITEFRQSPKS